MHSILVLVISANHTEVRVLQSILREQSEGEVAIVGSADRGEDALSRSLALRPQVILVNLDRTEDGALEIVSRLCGLVLEAGIVALIPTAGSVYEEMARAAGADAVVARSDVAMSPGWSTGRQPCSPSSTTGLARLEPSACRVAHIYQRVVQSRTVGGSRTRRLYRPYRLVWGRIRTCDSLVP